MDNLNSMSGVEFERLCKNLLARMGFTVEMTEATGDGGIDLIARYDTPILSGKYIIQCKRHVGSVGVPVVRDLYGVVTAERANKGVLITSGDVTAAASEFACGKNLELIDGAKLRSMLALTGVVAHSQNTPESFIDFDKFDSERYRYYLDSVSRNPKDFELTEDFLFEFLMKYLVDDSGDEESLDLIHAGLAEEYVRQLDKYFDQKYGRRKKTAEDRKYDERELRDFARLYTFDLSEFVSSRLYRLRRQENALDWLGAGSIERGYYGDAEFRSSDAFYDLDPSDRIEFLRSAMKDNYTENSDLHGGWDFPGTSNDGLMKIYRSRFADDSEELLPYLCCDSVPAYADLYWLLRYFNLDSCCNRVIDAMGFGGEFRKLIINQAPFEAYQHNVLIGIPGQSGEYCEGRFEGPHDNPVLNLKENSLNLTPYFNRFAPLHREKIESELKKIKQMVDYLPLDTRES